MKHTWLTGLLAGAGMALIVMTLTSGLWAEGPAAPTGRVACADVGRAFNEYQRMKDINEELKALQQKLEAENEQRVKANDALQATVDAMAADDPARAKKMSELLEAEVSRRTWAEVQQAHLARELALATDRIYRDVLAATEEVARQAGYDLVVYSDEYPPGPPSIDLNELREVMRSRKLLYASQAVDITQLVLDQLNAEYKAKPRTQELMVP